MDNWEKIKKKILSDNKVKGFYDDMEVEYQLLADLIKLRNKKKLTQREPAEKMGTTQSALSRFEMGGVSPSVAFLKKVARALDVQLSIKFLG